MVKELKYLELDYFGAKQLATFYIHNCLEIPGFSFFKEITGTLADNFSASARFAARRYDVRA